MKKTRHWYSWQIHWRRLSSLWRYIMKCLQAGNNLHCFFYLWHYIWGMFNRASVPERSPQFPVPATNKLWQALALLSMPLESLLNLLNCYILLQFSLFFPPLLMAHAASNWKTVPKRWFGFMQDAVAEHKQEIQKKKDEIERLKRGMTFPDVESKVSVVWIQFSDMICAIRMKYWRNYFLPF